MQDRVWGEKEIKTEDRVLENPHSCGGRGAERQGIQEEKEFPESWGWFPYLLPLFQCYPPSSPPHFSRGGVGAAQRHPGTSPSPGMLPGERQSSQRLECLGSRTAWKLGRFGRGDCPLPHPSWLCGLRRATPPVIFSLFFTFPRGSQQDFLHRAAATIKRDNVRYALGTWAWQALRAQ